MSQFSIFGSTSNNVSAITNPLIYPYTVTSSDSAIIVDTTSSRIVNLPINPLVGMNILIKDGSGLSNSNPITVSSGVKTIDSQIDYTIQQTYGYVGLLFNGIEWNVINQ